MSVNGTFQIPGSGSTGGIRCACIRDGKTCGRPATHEMRSMTGKLWIPVCEIHIREYESSDYEIVKLSDAAPSEGCRHGMSAPAIGSAASASAAADKPAGQLARSAQWSGQAQPELLPCPFCGETSPAASLQMADTGEYRVWCPCCRALGPSAMATFTNQPVELWNRRAGQTISAPDASPAVAAQAESDAPSTSEERAVARNGTR